MIIWTQRGKKNQPKTWKYLFWFAHLHTHSNTHTHQEISGFHTSVTVSANCSPFAPPVGSVCQLLCLCCPFTPLHTSTYTHRCTCHHLHHHLSTNIYHFRFSEQSWYHSSSNHTCTSPGHVLPYYSPISSNILSLKTNGKVLMIEHVHMIKSGIFLAFQAYKLVVLFRSVSSAQPDIKYKMR